MQVPYVYVQTVYPFNVQSPKLHVKVVVPLLVSRTIHRKVRNGRWEFI